MTSSSAAVSEVSEGPWLGTRDMIRGAVFDIQRFSIHDGPGIRTTVFLKGCPLKCLWCHNPESQDPRPQLMFHEGKCLLCGACVRACSKGAQERTPEARTFNRENCDRCMDCVSACPSGALETAGQDMSVKEVMAKVLRDRPFYESSGGGMTLSGGEPLAQHGFSLALLRTAKRLGLHTTIETCGLTRWNRLESLLPWVDLFLYDLKESDSERHRAWTGAGNGLILKNLERLHERGARIRLRCPIIPGFNDRAAHFAFLRAVRRCLPGLEGLEVMPYHASWGPKAQALGRKSEIACLASAARDHETSWRRELEEAR